MAGNKLHEMKSNIDEHEFHILFERLVDSMTNPATFKRDEFVQILFDLCKLFDICRGVTEFYAGPVEEQLGNGEILEDYNDGRKGEVVLFKRVVTSQFTVVKNTLWRPTNTFPLTELDMQRLDLVIRSLISFISRNRLTTEVERLAFFDVSGYPNLNTQGFYFDKPLPVDEFEKRLKDGYVVA
ncbi:MAG: hypothetical protein IJS09_04070 [Treponema sp.]|nr:hypothetical protein [Treponema sp.]